jgi:hypothetical protein
MRAQDERAPRSAALSTLCLTHLPQGSTQALENVKVLMKLTCVQGLTEVLPWLQLMSIPGASPKKARTRAMLPPFIIDQIRRREEDVQRRQELDRPRLELPIDVYHPAPEPKPSDDESGERGVIILDLG